MSESPPCRASSANSNSSDSFDFIESCDLPPPVLQTVTSETNSATITETFSFDSEELLEPAPAQVPATPQVQEQEELKLELEELDPELQRTPPIVATKVHVVADIPPPRSPSSKNENEDNNNNEDEECEISRERKIGAGITIGIISAPICGPVLAVIAGVAAAYGTSKPGVTGDTCRAAGDIAIVAKEKLMEVEQKHDVVNKTKESANQMIDRAKEANEKHRIMENLKKIMMCTLKNLGDALQFAADKMKETRENNKKQGRDRDGESTNAGSDGIPYSYEKLSAVNVEAK